MVKTNHVHYGGKLSDYPQPWILRYGNPDNDEKRPVKIHSIVFPTFGHSLGANGHHHADIKEEDNYIWSDKEQAWCRPWNPEYGEPLYDDYQKLIKGRSNYNSDFVKAKDVKAWALKILKDWGTTKQAYAIEWDLGKDDPNALAMSNLDTIRKNIERNSKVVDINRE